MMIQHGRILLAFILIPLILTPNISISKSNTYLNTIKWISIYAPAVAESKNGLVGVMVRMWVGVSNGSGDVYISTMPLTEIDMQASVRIAALVACQILGLNYNKYNFYVKMYSRVPIMGGPSAGALITVAFISLLANLKINRYVSMTGMINPDGTIGPVGGIFEKAVAAEKMGFRLFLIPYGQDIVYREHRVEKHIGPITIEEVRREAVNITDYAIKHKWRMRIIQVSDIYEALKYFTNHTVTLPRVESIEIPSEILNVFKYIYIKTYDNTSYLKKIVSNEYSKLVDSRSRDFIKRLLDEGDEYLDEAFKEANQSYYYTAASKCFKAEIVYRYADYLIKVVYLKNTTYSDLVDYYRELYSKIDSELKSVNRTLDNLDLITGCYIRLGSASDAFNKAVELYKEGKISDSLYWLSYAVCRLETTSTWLNIAKKYARGINVYSRLRNIAYFYTSEARSVAIYSYMIVEEAGISGSVSNWINQAMEYSSKALNSLLREDYELAIAYSIEAIALASSSLNMLIPSTEYAKVFNRYVYESRRYALISIYEAMNISKPILALAYLEMANRSSGFNKLLMYKYSALYSRLLIAISEISGLKHPSIQLTTSYNVNTPKPKEANTSKVGIAVTSFIYGFIVGLLIAIFIVVLIYVLKSWRK